MALRIWAPLNGDLRQIGASNAILTNDGATIDNSGKIGKCYAFANTHIIIDSTDVQDFFSSPSQSFSMACWIYLNSNETDRVIIFGNYSANPFVNWELAANCTQRLCIGGTSNYTNRTNSTVVPKTTWTHIAVTYNGATTTFYQNGIAVGSINGVNTLTTKTASSRFYLGSDVRNDATRLKGKMNDFRLYDHCLSAAEVHEISQGLVLHYKLDDLENGVLDSSGYGRHGILHDTSAILSSTSARYNACIKNNQATNSSNYLLSGECNIPESTALTFSWWMKPTAWGMQTSGIFSTTNNSLPTDYNLTTANMRDSCFDCCNVSGACVRINVSSHLTLNEWHHYALVYNGSQLIFYKDGVSKVTANQSGALKSFSRIFPFYSLAGGAHRTTSGELSDFRIYCTALDADDILALYHTSAKIDNKQNLHTFELVESATKISINKQGQILCNELEETTTTKFFKTDKIIETNNLIEL